MQLKRMMSRLMAAACTLGVLSCGIVCGAQNETPKPEDVKKVEAALPDKAPAEPKQKRKVLVFGRAAGFVHSSIPLGCQTIKLLGEKTGAWESTISYDPAMFEPEKLKDFDAIVLVSTTGNFLEENGDKATGEKRMKALIDFVKGGKGLAGIHAASDANYDNRQYGEMMGGYFNGHPWHEKVGVKVDDPKSPLTQMFDKNGIDIVDEIYQFTPKGKDKDGKEQQTYSREKLHVLLSLDYTTEGRTAHKGKAPNDDFGVAWIHDDGKGRVFYCSLGHREDVYWNPTILKFYLAGIQFALGDLPADATPSVAGPSAAAK